MFMTCLFLMHAVISFSPKVLINSRFQIVHAILLPNENILISFNSIEGFSLGHMILKPYSLCF